MALRLAVLGAPSLRLSVFLSHLKLRLAESGRPDTQSLEIVCTATKGFRRRDHFLILTGGRKRPVGMGGSAEGHRLGGIEIDAAPLPFRPTK